MFLTSGGPDFSRRVSVHRGYPQAHNEIEPRRAPKGGGKQPRRDNLIARLDGTMPARSPEAGTRVVAFERFLINGGLAGVLLIPAGTAATVVGLQFLS